MNALTLAGARTWRVEQHVAARLLFIGTAFFQLRGTLPFVLQERVVVSGAHGGLLDVILVLVNRSLVGLL